MAKQNVVIPSIGNITLTDSNFLASGGESDVYVYPSRQWACAISKDTNKNIPVDKIKELQKISSNNVLIPLDVVQNKQGKVIGFVMDYKPNCHPLVKVFVKSFRKQHGCEDSHVNDLCKVIKSTVQDIHAAQCLVVDMNEMNILIDKGFRIPYFIDTLSYQTPSHPATAIMASIRDPLVKNNQWTQNSDWFSYAILAFQLWIGIHPYKGQHPKYKLKDWIQRMEDGVSVFDKHVKIPVSCPDFNVIPSRLRGWMENVFQKNERSCPPQWELVSSAIPQSFQFISSNASFDINKIYTLEEAIRSVFNIGNIRYFVTKHHIYKEDKKIVSLSDGKSDVRLVASDRNSPVIIKEKNNLIEMFNFNGEKLGSIQCDNYFLANNCVYTTNNGRLYEHSFISMGGKILHSNRQSANVQEFSFRTFKNVAFQELMGKMFIVYPFQKKSCLVKHLPELDNYRIVSATAKNNICAVVGEMKGKFDRFVFDFDDKYQDYIFRKQEDVSTVSINLSVLPNGIGFLVNDINVEIFKGNNVKIIDNVPFDCDNETFIIGNTVNFVEGNSVYSVKSK